MLTCDTNSDFDDQNMGARIASIFVMLAVSAFGSFFPLLESKWKFFKLPADALYLIKHFGTGVILATAYIHLLGEAQDNLGNPCLTGIWTNYPWASGICLMGTFSMFTIELFVLQLICRKHRLSLGSGELESSLTREEITNTKNGSNLHIQDDVVRPEQCNVEEIDWISQQEHGEPPFKRVMTIFLLEFGIVFHSVFVGLSLAIAGDEFKTLFVAISFHQFFEGLGLASRFVSTTWPENMRIVPWIFSLIYSLTTPIGVAAGLGVRHMYLDNSTGSLIVIGVFDAFCAGLLIYNCLVELMAQDFLIEPDMQNKSGRRVFTAYALLVLGTLLMALIGRWA